MGGTNMNNTATINTRIDPETKKQAVKILHSLGLTTTQAIYVFFKQIIYTGGIPFELKVPNETTIETFKKTDAGRELHRVSGVKELAKELKS
jgi:DNA-damage-inducible protein J